ncbi:hypothetical protein A3I95_02105 [Candidatus Nomurabacteria bacterium RIFCSPLOWO2_02_FULL_44_12]|uniref:Uncharacterized protein n=1 Tax=Candidatus Nomurabacteria bacterium RIFCSPLOWO2_12_FULL_44_11 TaxID=1801796 RepID=A0A1F6Y5X1_9BACT|nr:MAG: hypothetical protein A3E95_01905 [Candidatus Nomurabacteria bacterium RIFCSPHIGHO2_12_FULL_44_22b]OGJ01763.1 MAG: hypothetical protein A3G53_00940 [Candidatus Nomurabacteria bacterium RIFCSPLOWO2_12_FULL_44_11]OGJ07285.1 MAG: hypothetical protein A3I95_02105 [Candidatus Nomurabacteria bacterium RIFCSPLOWO2_02_FULL_44_12]
MEPEQKTNGALLGSIIIIIILIIGGIYLWKASLKENTLPETNNLGTADGTANLEAEANNIDLEGLDQEI